MAKLTKNEHRQLFRAIREEMSNQPDIKEELYLFALDIQFRILFQIKSRGAETKQKLIDTYGSFAAAQQRLSELIPDYFEYTGPQHIEIN